MLDEPTNHLDFETVEALAKALKTFAGTIFFISHDRTFVNLIANHILEVKNGKIMKYPGRYEDYVYYLEKQAQEEFAPYRKGGRADKPQPSSLGNPRGENSKAAAKPGAPQKSAGDSKKDIRSEMNELNKKIQKAENRLNHFKNEKEKLQVEMAKNPFFDSKTRGARLKELQGQIQEEENTWLEFQDQYEKLKQKLEASS